MKSRNKGGRSGKDSFIVYNAARFVNPESKLKIQRPDEFYKKGCQEKKLRLDRRREDLFLEIQPTVCKSASRFEREVLVLACLPFLWGSSADGDDANRVWKG